MYVIKAPAIKVFKLKRINLLYNVYLNYNIYLFNNLYFGPKTTSDKSSKFFIFFFKIKCKFFIYKILFTFWY